MKWTGCGKSLRLVTHEAPRPRLVIRMSSTWSATRRAASGLPSAALAAAMAARRAPVAEQLGDEARQQGAVELGVVHQERRAAGDHLARVLALVVGGGVRVRHQDRRLAEGGELGDGAARARHDQVGRRHGGGQAVSVGHQPIALKPLAALLQIARAPAPRSSARRRARAGTPRSLPPKASTQARLMLWAPWLPPKASTTGRSGCRSKASLPCSRRRVELPGAERPPRDDVAGRLQPVDGEAQAEPLDERPEQPVGDAQVRVGLERQAGDAARRCHGHDRAAGEPAAADGHVRPGLLEDAADVRHGGGQQL